jgi:hypothetical protein
MNVVAFQAAWLGAVGGAGADLLWLGPVTAAAAVAAHLALAKRPGRELAAVAVVATVGASWDVASAALGVVEYRGGLAALGGAPPWIVALWLAFATTLNASLRWLKARTVLAVGLGAVGGPLSYAAAQRLGAVALPEPTSSLAVQALGWALLLPACLRIADRFDGWRARSPDA